MLPMTKNYFYSILLLLCCFSLPLVAQENKQQPTAAIEELSFYPNPVSNGKIYITSKTSQSKEIAIYDVLGKKVLQASLNVNAKELNVASLSPGVYIIKIKEGEATATRKLIVK